MRNLRRFALIAGLVSLCFSLSGCFDDWFGSDKDREPPTITATISPAPNEAGWNNSDVTVSFVCADEKSAIVYCPESVGLQQEGAGQVIAGTAMDIAGNTTTVRVTINIDKTPPNVSVLSPDSGATVEDSPVLVEGSVEDGLSGVTGVTCNGNPVDISGSSFSDPVTLATGENEILLTASDVAGNTGQATLNVTYLGPRLAAIVDVLISYDPNLTDVPDDYTGLRYGEATNPFIPNESGDRVTSDFVNYWPPLLFGYRPPAETLLFPPPSSIWVKFDSVLAGSDQEVLTDYRVVNWGDLSCPAGYELAQGNSLRGPGVLSSPIDCVNRTSVLCVRYEPMYQTERFVTTVGLSMNDRNSTPACAAFGEANSAFWPMQNDASNIFHGCDEWRYLCSAAQVKKWPPMPTSINLTGEQKLDLLTTYAPRVWIHDEEVFWPSSVEWAFPHQHRTLCRTTIEDEESFTVCDQPQGTTNAYYWLHTREALSEPDQILAFFHGCNGNATSSPCTIEDVPVYAFLEQKRHGDYDFEYVDLVYFFYFPYNLGKEVPFIGAIATVGNHVGDWEHMTVRLHWAYDEQVGWSLQPIQTYLSAHSFGGLFKWDAMPKADETHPIVYSALGSHGLWLTAGEHVYYSGVFDLSDLTSAGTAWDTWRRVEAFDFDLESGQGLSDNTWPRWMSENYGEALSDPEDCSNPSDPACGPIYRWGNPKQFCGEHCFQVNGPTGPIAKNVWDDGPIR